MAKNLRKFNPILLKQKLFTFPDTKEKSDIQLVEDTTPVPVDNIKSQNCSSMSHTVGAENVQCSSNSTAIPYVSLTVDEEPVPETKDDCSHCTYFQPTTCIPLKSEVNHAEESTPPVTSEDKIERSSIWVTHDG